MVGILVPFIHGFHRHGGFLNTQRFVSARFTTLRVSSASSNFVRQSSSTGVGDRSDMNTILKPLVVCGPSGAGKGTLIAKFMETFAGADNFGFVTSHTTRKPRVGEVDGVHYHFVSIESMKREIAEDCFLEYAEVHGNFYGTSWQALRDVQDAGRYPLLDIDVQGVKNIKEKESGTLRPRYVFIAPPSLEVLEQRLRGRGTESEEAMAIRTANACAEVEYGLRPGNFDQVVVNDDLNKACQEFARATLTLF